MIYNAIATIQATISNTALTLVTAGIADAIRARAQEVTISVRSGEINIKFDGTAPTTSTGTLIVAGATAKIYGAGNANALRMIRNGGTNAVVDIVVGGV